MHLRLPTILFHIFDANSLYLQDFLCLNQISKSNLIIWYNATEKYWVI